MDVRTLAIVMGALHLAMVVVLAVQFGARRGYHGVGWWLAWTIAAAAGLACVPLRLVPAFTKAAILLQNPLLVAAALFLYVGLLRFFGRREPAWLPWPGLAVYAVGHAAFVLWRDDIEARTVAVCLALAAIGFASAHVVLIRPPRAVAAAARLCGVAFVVHGVVFLHRGLATLAGADVSDMFQSTPFHLAPFLDGILVAFLWTCGVIMMLHQRAASDAEAARTRFQLLFRTSPDAVLICRASDGACLEVNDAFETLSGHSRQEVLGRGVLSLGCFEDPGEGRVVAAELRERGLVENREVAFLRPDGSALTGMLSARLLSLEGVPHVISVVRDITGRKHAEERVRRLNTELEERVRERTAQLEASVRELEAFTSVASHDLRAPLRAINGYARILEEGHAGRLDGEGLRLLAVVRSEAARLGLLIDALLEFFRLGRATLSVSQVDMSRLAREVGEELVQGETARPIELRVGALPVASGDRALLRRLWSILLGNAVKHTRDRQPAVIEVDATWNEREMVCRVRDNGVGFDMRHASRLFEVFHRIHGSDSFEGSGAGLALARRIVQRHGGRIWADAEPGRGATFSFALPVPSGSQAPALATESRQG